MSIINISKKPSLLHDLFVAYYQARKNKRNTINQLEFEINYEAHLIQLYHDIVNKKYSISPSICFIINKPVKREIFAASFRDRVVHHLVFNYINPTFENKFIEDSYSCRKNKGTHYGVQKLNAAIQTCSQNYTQDCYVLKLDIKGYFMSINKNILHKNLQDAIQGCKNMAYITKKRSLYLVETILADNPTLNCVIKGCKSNWKNLPKSKSLFGTAAHCGLPIGNLTSQLFSNVYLHSFDLFMKKDLRIEHYGRYVDDFYVVGKCWHTVKSVIAVAKNYLDAFLGLTLHPQKVVLQHYSKGVNFLGATIKPHRIYVSNRTKYNFIQCVAKWKLFLQNNIPTLRDLQKLRASINSYIGVMMHYSTYNIRHKQLVLDRNNGMYTYGYLQTKGYKNMLFKLYGNSIHFLDLKTI